MLRSRFALLTLTFAAALVVLGGPAAAGDRCRRKATICHKPPGQPAKAHTITVGASALGPHLAHGDQLGVCPSTCRANGSDCGDDSACCSGLCSAGVCAAPCAQNGVACAGDAQCCTGFCNQGTCATPCAAEGAACGAGGDCCGGNCRDGQCAAACAGDGNACETGGDCCSGICTDTSKTCASQCTIGPELHGLPCDEDLDCCEGQGICIIGLCYAENFGCSAIGQACNPDEGAFCCFDNACVDGLCAEP